METECAASVEVLDNTASCELYTKAIYCVFLYWKSEHHSSSLLCLDLESLSSANIGQISQVSVTLHQEPKFPNVITWTWKDLMEILLKFNQEK